MSTPFSRLQQIKEIVEGIEPADKCDSWHCLYQKLIIAESKLEKAWEIVKEYEQILGMEST